MSDNRTCWIMHIWRNSHAHFIHIPYRCRSRLHEVLKRFALGMQGKSFQILQIIHSIFKSDCQNIKWKLRLNIQFLALLFWRKPCKKKIACVQEIAAEGTFQKYHDYKGSFHFFLISITEKMASPQFHCSYSIVWAEITHYAPSRLNLTQRKSEKLKVRNWGKTWCN